MGVNTAPGVRGLGVEEAALIRSSPLKNGVGVKNCRTPEKGVEDEGKKEKKVKGKRRFVRLALIWWSFVSKARDRRFFELRLSGPAFSAFWFNTQCLWQLAGAKTAAEEAARA